MEDLRVEAETLTESRNRLALKCIAIKDLVLADIEVENITKLLGKIEQNDDAVRKNHDELTVEDEELVDEDHGQKLEDHRQAVKEMRLQLRKLSNRKAASEIITDMKTRLADLEEDLADDGYTAVMNVAMNQLEQGLQELRIARGKPGAATCPEIEEQVKLVKQRARIL